MSHPLLQTLTLPSYPVNRSFTIYRGDLEHPNAPGNKWHKLKHHLINAKHKGSKYIATFGGPHSNHLHAFAQSVAMEGLIPIAVVRGEVGPKLTPTLADIASVGTILFPSLRKEYRLGLDSDIKELIDRHYSNAYWVPEGGGGEEGILGCYEWGQQIKSLIDQYQFDAVAVSAGTGTTALGLGFAGIAPHLCVFSALKGADDQQAMLQQELTNRRSDMPVTLHFWDDDWNGGFGKLSSSLTQFLARFTYLNSDLPLDPVYTAKLVCKIDSLVQNDEWPFRKTLIIHTGGLQGWRGFDQNTPS